jgi:hypothetical protein
MKRKSALLTILVAAIVGTSGLTFRNQQIGVLASPASRWSQTYGGTNWDSAYSVIQTTDGGYGILGETLLTEGDNDFWFVKTDTIGNMLWNRTYGGAGDDRGRSVVQTVDGGYVLVGETSSFGAGKGDFWLIKTDASGDVLWNKTYGGFDDDAANSVIQDSDGGYALAGYTGSFSTGIFGFWLIRIDMSGNVLWNKTYGGTEYDEAYSLVQTKDGGFALAGYTYSFGAGYADFWLVRTDASGDVLWNKTYGGTNYDAAFSMVQTSDGGYALAGYTESFGAVGMDFWLVKTDENGIIPEFPSFHILPPLMLVTLFAVWFRRRKRYVSCKSFVQVN